MKEMEKLIKAIHKHLEGKRVGKYMFDNDDTTEQVIEHFRKCHYKVFMPNSYTVIIKKRWWQK
jgi:hypothetical protein